MFSRVLPCERDACAGCKQCVKYRRLGDCDVLAAAVAQEPPTRRRFADFLAAFGTPFVERARRGECLRLQGGEPHTVGSAMRCVNEILCGGLYASHLSAWLRLGVRVVVVATNVRGTWSAYSRVIVGLKRMLIDAPPLHEAAPPVGVMEDVPASATQLMEEKWLCSDLPRASRTVNHLYGEEVAEVRRIAASHPNVSLVDPAMLSGRQAWLTLPQCAYGLSARELAGALESNVLQGAMPGAAEQAIRSQRHESVRERLARNQAERLARKQNRLQAERLARKQAGRLARKQAEQQEQHAADRGCGGGGGKGGGALRGGEGAVAARAVAARAARAAVAARAAGGKGRIVA